MVARGNWSTTTLLRAIAKVMKADDRQPREFSRNVTIAIPEDVIIIKLLNKAVCCALVPNMRIPSLQQ